MRNRVLHQLLLAFAASSLFACAADSHDSAPTTNVEPSKLLASLSLEGGRVVEFHQTESGPLFMTETAKAADGPSVTADMGGASFSDIYRKLAPGAAVPQPLLDAEQHAASSAPADATPPPDDAHEHGDGPDFYTTAQQTWFKQTYCPNAVKCIQGWDWIDSGSDHTTSWKSTAMVGSEGTATIPHIGQYWKCTNGSCSWVQFVSINLAPGHVTWVSGSGLFYYRSTISNAGSNTQVSMAINDAPWNCAHCNDGSCQCGYMDDANLCSGRGGADPNIGCVQQQ